VIAPAKLNLCLYLGPQRADGLHEICSLFQPLELADRISVTQSESGRDEVICPGLEGPNLAAAALAALREEGWLSPPLRIEIDKRIPVAAGLGGGSADAAAVLRLAADEVDGLERIAARLGADVPSQIEPRFALVRGAGERVEPLPDPGEWAAVLIPDERGLSTAAVYAESDRLGLARAQPALEEAGTRLAAAAAAGASPLDYAALLVNDLGRAATSLRPEMEIAIDALRDAGAAAALPTGSGPTVFGLFENIARADAGAAALPERYAGAIVTAPGRVAR
jgi:4-diphosphocytidyl-2-C-methyl-D-erythritol kinase